MAKTKTKVRICSTKSSRTSASTTTATSTIAAAMSSGWRRGILGALAEDAYGTQHEDQDQQHEGHRIAPGAAEEERREALHDAVEEPADDGASHAAEAAENDDGEGLDRGQGAGVRAERVDDAVERAGEGGEGRADAEARHVDPADVDAHQHGRHPVLTGPPHLAAERRAEEEDPEADHDGPGHREQDHEVVPEVDHAEGEHVGGVRRPDLRVLTEVRDEDAGQRILEDEDQGDGQEHLVDLGGAADRAEAQTLDEDAERRHEDHRAQHAEVRVDAEAIRPEERQEGAGHHELAVSEVDDLHDAEDQSQARSQEHVDTAGDEAPDEDLEQPGGVENDQGPLAQGLTFTSAMSAGQTMTGRSSFTVSSQNTCWTKRKNSTSRYRGSKRIRPLLTGSTSCSISSFPSASMSRARSRPPACSAALAATCTAS